MELGKILLKPFEYLKYFKISKATGQLLGSVIKSWEKNIN
jgi:hypothetical protein